MLKLIKATKMSLEYVDKYIRNNMDCYDKLKIELEDTLDYYEYITNSDDSLYYLIDDENNKYIVGFTIITKINNNSVRVYIEIRTKLRNKGLGNDLFFLVIDLLKRNKIKKIYMECNSEDLCIRNIIENNSEYILDNKENKNIYLIKKLENKKINY